MSSSRPPELSEILIQRQIEAEEIRLCLLCKHEDLS